MLTPEQIDALDLDELNAEVAKACGWHVEHVRTYRGTGERVPQTLLYGAADEGVVAIDGAHEMDGMVEFLPDYARDISAAWELAEWLRQWRNPNHESTFTIAGLVDSWWAGFEWFEVDIEPHGEGSTAPEAICRAYLKVKHHHADT